MMERIEEGWAVTDRAIKILMFIFTIVGGLFTAGVSYASAHYVVAQKADRRDLEVMDGRFTRDSLRYALLGLRMEALETRITQLMCYKNPNPACR